VGLKGVENIGVMITEHRDSRGGSIGMALDPAADLERKLGTAGPDPANQSGGWSGLSGECTVPAGPEPCVMLVVGRSQIS
jgi:hypothetical protein